MPQVSVALQLNAIFDFNQQSQQLSADFMLVTNWTDKRCLQNHESLHWLLIPGTADPHSDMDEFHGQIRKLQGAGRN